MQDLIDRNKDFFDQYKDRLNNATSFEQMLEVVRAMFPNFDDDKCVETAKLWCKFREVVKIKLQEDEIPPKGELH